MPPRPPRRPRIPSRTIAILGAVVAGTLLLAATLDFGDPRLAARAQATRSARASGELVRLAWEGMLRSDRPPGSAGAHMLRIETTGVEARKAIQHSGGVTSHAPSGSSLAPYTLFNVLLESAQGAAAAGDLAAAITTARDALRLPPEDLPPAPRLAECRLALTRWWSTLEEPLEVAAQRRAIRELDTLAYLEGTSVELLACLVPPIDASLAHQLLMDGVPDLPTPADRWAVESGSLRFEPDPWWMTLQRELAANSASDLNWDLAFQVQARVSAAGREWLAGRELPEAGSGWQFTRVARGGDALIALRHDASGLDAALLPQANLEAALAQGTAEEVRLPLELRFGSDAGIGEVLYGPIRLPQLLRPFSIGHREPELGARGELRRLALLRGALVVLAAAVLGVSLLGARALSRSRRLASLRSTFVASVSHDLRTPTQAILLMAETLEQGRVGQGSAATRGRYYSRIRREAQRLRRLVEDLLDGARIDRGEGARIQRKDVATGPFLDELERAMQESAASAGAKLQLRRDDLPESISMDPDGVHRAVWNVFENALRYGKSEDGLADVEVEIEYADGAMVVMVADRGRGIDPTDHEAVFAPFERLDGRRTRQSEGGAGTGAQSDDAGTGLGLAIVRAIARGHGGDASITDGSIGTQFKLTFPEQNPRDDEAA